MTPESLVDEPKEIRHSHGHFPDIDLRAVMAKSRRPYFEKSAALRILWISMTSAWKLDRQHRTGGRPNYFLGHAAHELPGT
jgi:hypothetical protein